MESLARRPAGLPPATRQPVSPPFGGTWQVVNQALGSSIGACDPQLLTDGTVIVQDCGAADWWKLTPDITGSYVKGSWTQIASLPVINGTQYAPLYNAAAVLPDGRVIIMGGEYNGSNPNEVWTSMGAIYDPVANSWKAVSPPSGAGWVNTSRDANNPNGGIGDAASIVLPDGTFLLSAAIALPAVDALLDATALTWTATGAPIDSCVLCRGVTYQDEQGYTLLPSGTVMTVDVWDPPHAEQYNSATGKWTDIASTPVSLIDPVVCGNYEIGPAVTRPDGSVVAFGGNTGCPAAGSPADPTAIYAVSSKSWIQGPYVPTIDGAHYTLPDAPAAMLPNGNILFAASPGYGNPPTHFFEFTSAASGNSINQVADDIYYASTSGAYLYEFLVLPTGQILVTDFSNEVEIYTPKGSPDPSWMPVVISVPDCVTPGDTYSVEGRQLNGLTQGAAYGDDVQGATNYPSVQIVNNRTQHIFYARTYGHSTMSIAPGQAGSTNFKVTTATETGASTLYVVANGIASAGTPVTVSNSCAVAGPKLVVTPATGIAAFGVEGGPFSPSSFSYKLSATEDSAAYSITDVPVWLTASSTSGTVTKTATAITFKINPSADKLTSSSPSTITIKNTTNGLGNTTLRVALTVDPPALTFTPATNMTASGVQGGRFSPSSFSYKLSATGGTVAYAITNVPSWLTVSSTSGTVTKAAKAITFTINSSVDDLTPGTKISSVNIKNTTNGLGNSAVTATLTIKPKDLDVTVEASPAAGGTVSGGGTFAEGSSNTVTATAKSGFAFVHWAEGEKVVSTKDPYTFILGAANVALVAVFEKR
ncbi:MAG TPA: hypothetical protein VME69_05915 [Methylocella sp.]|nr:hypothetical protein [Methylocella sp.]